jgi:hypothetical protein
MIRLVEEEDVKKACDKADLKGVALGSDHVKEQEEEVEVDLNLFPEKKRNKIINQRTRDAEKGKEKTKNEAKKAKDKADREAKKVRKQVSQRHWLLPVLHFC